MANKKVNISKEMLESVYNNKNLTLKEKLKVLDCSDNHMYSKLRDYGIPTIKPYPKDRKIKEPEPEIAPVTVKSEEPIISNVRGDTHTDIRMPDFQTYNIHLTLRFKPENKADFFAAIELLKEMFK